MPPNIGSLKVLLVEDHFFMRNIWRTMLAGMDIKLITDAATVEDAFIAMESETFDVAIVDYHFARGAKGADFIRKVRAMDGDPAQFMPIIGCTADARRAVIADFIEAGVDEVVGKPVSATAVYSRIHAVIQNRRAFVRTKVFFGPDRRRKEKSFIGDERRDQDNA